MAGRISLGLMLSGFLTIFSGTAFYFYVESPACRGPLLSICGLPINEFPILWSVDLIVIATGMVLMSGGAFLSSRTGKTGPPTLLLLGFLTAAAGSLLYLRVQDVAALGTRTCYAACGGMLPLELHLFQNVDSVTLATGVILLAGGAFILLRRRGLETGRSKILPSSQVLVRQSCLDCLDAPGLTKDTLKIPLSGRC
jgi:hypothetical protein